VTTSTKLGIPYIASQQASPEITHNVALYMIEALLRGVKAQQNAPPGGTPADGDTYLVGTAGSGAWSGKNNLVAIWVSNAWRFVPGFDDDGSQIAIGADHEGMRLFLQDVNYFVRWPGSTAWVSVDQEQGFTVATLPAAATYPRARTFVTDSNTALTAGIGAVVAGGGANVVPVHSDGANWRIG
jgi:hypothetical protein